MKYRKKQSTVEAIQFTEENHKECSKFRGEDRQQKLDFKFSVGGYIVQKGDYIVRDGDMYF